MIGFSIIISDFCFTHLLASIVLRIFSQNPFKTLYNFSRIKYNMLVISLYRIKALKLGD